MLKNGCNQDAQNFLKLKMFFCTFRLNRFQNVELKLTILVTGCSLKYGIRTLLNANMNQHGLEGIEIKLKHSAIL